MRFIFSGLTEFLHFLALSEKVALIQPIVRKILLKIQNERFIIQKNELHTEEIITVIVINFYNGCIEYNIIFKYIQSLCLY